MCFCGFLVFESCFFTKRGVSLHVFTKTFCDTPFLWSYHKYGSPVIANQSDDVIVFSNGISNALSNR